jgi:hypothetical protein
VTKHFLYLNEFGDALLINHDTESTLQTLQTLVEGYVQCVSADPHETGITADIWINEEGLYQPTFAINLLASAFTRQQIVGPAVIARSNTEGETIGLTTDDLTAITSQGLVVDDNNGAGFTPHEATAIRAHLTTPH